jgi:phosphomannomutase
MLFLFDIDGTLCESGQQIKKECLEVLHKLKKVGNELGIVGGGNYTQIKKQLKLDQKENQNLFSYLFCENGCILYKQNQLIYESDIRKHAIWTSKILQILLKSCLLFLSQSDFDLCGHHVDIRKGLIYVSLCGIQANVEERHKFLELDKKHNFRRQLFEKLNHTLMECGNSEIVVQYGGATGLNIIPADWDKTQILSYFQVGRDVIHYFGDKYHDGGNDQKLVFHEAVHGHPVDSVDETIKILSDIMTISPRLTV